MLMTAPQKILTGGAALVLLAVPVYQQTRINALKDEVAALNAMPRAPENRPVVARTGPAATPEASPTSVRTPRRTTPAGAEPSEPAGEGEVVARVEISGPGTATFTRRGNGVVLDSFQAAGGGSTGMGLPVRFP
jgi:hypothetical protein